MLNTLTKKILEPADVQGIKPNFDLLKIISKEISEKIETIIFDGEKTQLLVLTTNNFPESVKKILDNLTTKGYKYDLFYTDTKTFREIALSWYAIKELEEKKKAEIDKAQQQAAGNNAIDMIQKLYDGRDKMDEGEFVMELVRLSFQAGASDLHFQPEEKGILMRVRIDGILKKILIFEHKEWLRYLMKLKFLSGTKMNVDYIPQDGRFDFMADVKGEKKKIDVRVNFMPGVWNESTVMRYLDGTKGIQSFENIGFRWDTFDILKKNLEANFGMILVTGPTGSGKTTTLYSMLNTLNDGERKIITLEDPIEYMVSWLQQSQINYSKGYDYGLGLKAILRHDPEVILVGETRTLETAEISINAALTGHLVFTTLHTNSAIEAISRILSMGVQPYMLAPALNMICGQRLVRKLCTCATKRDANYSESEEIKNTIRKINDVKPSLKIERDGKIPVAVGCEKCNGQWYKWRIACVETLQITDTLKTMIIQGRTTLDIYGKVRETWYLTLQEDGMIKILRGMTTLEELRRVT